MTQQSASASEELATSSEELASQADQLMERISFFYLNKNTTDIKKKNKHVFARIEEVKKPIKNPVI